MRGSRLGLSRSRRQREESADSPPRRQLRSRIREPSPIDFVDYPLDEDADVEAVAALSIPRFRRIYDERKHKDFVAGTYVPHAPVIIGPSFHWINPLGSMLDISKGTGFNERTSDSIRVVRVGMKVILSHKARVKQIEPELPPVEPDPCYTGVNSITASHPNYGFMRVALVLDKQPILPVPFDPGLPWVTSTGDVHPIHSFRNTVFNERFDVLCDEIHTLTLGRDTFFEFEVGGTSLPFMVQQETGHRYERFKDLDFVCHYDDSPAGAGNVPAPNLYWAFTFAVNFNACNYIDAHFNARVTYDDNIGH